MDKLPRYELDEALMESATETANDTPHSSNIGTTDKPLNVNHDPEACLRMADDAIKHGDHPPIPTEFDDATMRFTSQADQILGTLSRMDLTIHRFMPDRSIYVKFKLDEIEAKFVSIRERIIKQETVDPREIARRALHGEYVAPVF